jgi:hypothetical protein
MEVPVSRSPISRRVAIALVASATAAASLAGCGGSSKSHTSSAAQPAGAASSKTATKAGSGGSGNSGGLPSAVNVCQLVPASRISQITGKTFTMAKEDDTPSYKLYSCNYTTDPTAGGGATAQQLDLDIVGENGAIALSADVDAAKQVNNKVTNLAPVSGIGDKAYGGGIEAHLEVVYGDVLIKLSGGTDTTIDQSKQIISELHSKL